MLYCETACLHTVARVKDSAWMQDSAAMFTYSKSRIYVGLLAHFGVEEAFTPTENMAINTQGALHSTRRRYLAQM